MAEADDAFYAAHPEMVEDGKRIPISTQPRRLEGIMNHPSAVETDTTKSEATPTAKEKFDLLAASYARIYERFVETAYRVTGILLIVLGWLLSSSTAQDLFRKDATVRYIVVAVLLVSAVLILGAFSRIIAMSSSVRTSLDSLRYHDQRHYDHHRITPRLQLAVIGLNMLLCALLIFLLIYIELKGAS